MKDKSGFLSRNYKKCWSFLKSSKNYIYFSILIFIFFTLIGFILPIFFQEEIISLVNNLSRQIEGLNLIQLIGFIFFNNLKTSFLAIALGIFLGIFPFAISIVNGYLLGFVARNSVDKAGVFVLWRVLPHGIFELPAVIMSIGIGMKLGIGLFKIKNTKEYKKEIIEALRFFAFVIFPLLLIAAIIEGLLIFYMK